MWAYPSVALVSGLCPGLALPPREWADPKEALTTGIEIVAQPPGKKLQSLSLLSGGERALTAIAILFAMLRCDNIT